MHSFLDPAPAESGPAPIDFSFLPRPLSPALQQAAAEWLYARVLPLASDLLKTVYLDKPWARALAARGRFPAASVELTYEIDSRLRCPSGHGVGWSLLATDGLALGMPYPPDPRWIADWFFWQLWLIEKSRQLARRTSEGFSGYMEIVKEGPQRPDLEGLRDHLLAARIHELKDQGMGRRRIAKAVGVSERQARKELSKIIP